MTIKQVTVTFEFEPETETVSKLHCFVDGIEKKKTRTVKKKDVVLEDEAIVTLLDNKLVLNNRAAAELAAEWQDRIVVKYEKFDKIPIPIIGKDIAFDTEGAGNKVTKTNTIAYRGKANTILKEYGSEFSLEPYKEGIFKLVSTDGTLPAYKAVEEKAENIDIPLISDEEPEIEIEKMTFKL